MSTPMYELPEHWYVSVDAFGGGPAEPDLTVAYACVCGADQCSVCPTTETPPYPYHKESV